MIGSGAAAPASAIVVTATTPLWYLTRATGLVALVLLTASIALGLLASVRYQRPGWPRSVTAGLHRNASVLACGGWLSYPAAPDVRVTDADLRRHAPSGPCPQAGRTAVLPWPADQAPAR